MATKSIKKQNNHRSHEIIFIEEKKDTVHHRIFFFSFFNLKLQQLQVYLNVKVYIMIYHQTHSNKFIDNSH